MLIRWVLVRDAEGSREPSCAPTSMPNPQRSWAGSSGAGGSRSPWPRFAATSVSSGSARDPTLLGLFSLVTLWANRIKGEHGVLPNRVRWYPKADPTFSDALALVRLELWTSPTFATSPDHRESAKNTDRLLNRLIRVACNPP